MRRAPTPQPLVRFLIPTPEGLTAAGPPAVSPNGRVIAFDAVDATGKRQIWIRPVDTVEARPLPGTEGAQRPISSPDSRLIAFRGEGKLRKVPVAGGPAQTICDAPTASDGTWNADGVILFDGTGRDPIMRVDSAGGVATPEVSTDSAKGTAASHPVRTGCPPPQHAEYARRGPRPGARALPWAPPARRSVSPTRWPPSRT
jgi:hypothetical protein